MRDATFCPADLTTFCRLDDLGLEVVGQQLHPDQAVLLCRVVDPDVGRQAALNPMIYFTVQPDLSPAESCRL